MDGTGSGETRAERRVFRSAVAVGFGVVWLAFAAVNLVDLALRGTGRDAAVLGALLLLATAVVYVTCLRPRIVADAAGVTVHNPLRNVRVPWDAVERIDATDTVRLRAGGRQYRCWAVQTSHRARARAQLREQSRAAKVGAQGVYAHARHHDHSRPDEIAAGLQAMAQRFRRDPDAGAGPAPDAAATVNWSPYALAALGATLVLVAVSMLAPLG